MQTLKGVVLGMMAQGAAHLALAWPFRAHIFPPNGWHLIPFVVGGLVCGRYARRALPAFFVGAPYAALILFADAMVDPGISAAALGLVVIGLALATTVCALMSRHRGAAPQPTTLPPQSDLPPTPER